MAMTDEELKAQLSKVRKGIYGLPDGETISGKTLIEIKDILLSQRALLVLALFTGGSGIVSFEMKPNVYGIIQMACGALPATVADAKKFLEVFATIDEFNRQAGQLELALRQMGEKE